MTLVFTICSNNYLAQAITLGQSLLTYNPLYIFKIGLVDKKDPQIDYSTVIYDIVEVEYIGISAFDDMFKRYSITELNTAVKPFYFNFFFNSIPGIESIIYLDPDIFIYRPFSELTEILKGNEIVVTPHFTTPINDDKILSENDFLNSGLYNLGFLALKKGDESQKLINWWTNRLEKKAFIDFAKGMFTDQIWINFAPLFFKKVFILDHPGYNMAYWNMHERSLIETYQVVKENFSFPLVFFHFSGYNPLQPKVLSKYQDRFAFENRKDVEGLFKEYANLLLRNGFSQYIQYPCYYAVEKQKRDLEIYLNYKKSIPLYKRIIRGSILRIIKLLKIDIEYYLS